MLVLLRIKNFVLIDTLELKLEPGFNVLTGETGAGKSIVVGALSLVLGGRASGELVRAGGTEAEVEALFDLSHRERALAVLDAAGVRNGTELVVRRVVHATGRSRAYLNGRLCTAGELQALAGELADVSSQHESLALTDPATHLSYLDRFAALVSARDALAGEVEELESLEREMDAVRKAERTRGEREAFLKFQLQSIEALDPKEGEIDALLAERQRLRNSGRLFDSTRRAAERLDQGDETICDELAKLARDVGAGAVIDPALEGPHRALEAALAELRDVSADLARYAEDVESDPSRLSEIEERLFRLESLVRQHGPTLGDVLATRARLSAEIEELANAEARLGVLAAARNAKLAEASVKARALRVARKKAADKLGKAISGELADLGMGNARVVVDVAPLGEAKNELVVDGARLGRDGIDRVEFLIAPNKGIDPRPLRRIASGGELSRATLALKRVLADSGPAGLYVFDEVDSGVGGAVADKIGRAIADVARHRQVLCITHLAPIAAFADAHYVVTKHESGQSTRSDVLRVDGKDRTHEVARMLGGAKVTPAAVRAASELIRDAHANP